MAYFYKHRNSKHFYYEKITLPYFGPWKKAVNALQQVTIDPLSEEEYLDYIKNIYPYIYENLEWVRFYDFVWRGAKSKGDLVPLNNFRFKLAVTNLNPIPKVRDNLFYMREEVTKQTGWYPLVQGSRAKITQPLYMKIKQKIIHNKNSTISIGKLEKIIDVSGVEGGNSFLLQGNLGNILFDTGFDVKKHLLKNVRLVCLSHFHKDHTGGIWSIIDDYSIPIILSEASLTYLWQLTNVEQSNKINLAQNSLVIEREMNYIDIDGKLESFPVFHCPGSYGFEYCDSFGQSVYYLNDICLKNGFLDSSVSILERIKKSNSNTKWVMMDAAMVGKSDFTIENEDTPHVILKELSESVNKRNVVFLSSSSEMLIYAYILTFKMTREASVKLVVNDELYNIIKTLWGAVILRQNNCVDPFVNSVIGNSKSNFVERQRVYPLTALKEINSDEKVIIFATVSDIEKEEAFKSRISKSDVVLAGTLALRSDIPQEVMLAKPRSILRIASEDWAFHSSESNLAEFIKALSIVGVKVLLCHNYPKVLRRFIKKYQLDQQLVFVNSSSEEGIPII